MIAMSEDAPTLKLRIRNGAHSHYNKVLVVSPLGLAGSERGAEDGNVYLGTLKHSMPDMNGKFTVLNDFVLPPFQLPGSQNGEQSSNSMNTFRVSEA